MLIAKSDIRPLFNKFQIVNLSNMGVMSCLVGDLHSLSALDYVVFLLWLDTRFQCS